MAAGTWGINDCNYLYCRAHFRVHFLFCSLGSCWDPIQKIFSRHGDTDLIHTSRPPKNKVRGFQFYWFEDVLQLWENTLVSAISRRFIRNGAYCPISRQSLLFLKNSHTVPNVKTDKAKDVLKHKLL